jgi:hypothetical protein
MNLLVRAARDLRRLVTPDIAFSAGIVAALVAVEALGRVSTNDLHDLIALTLLVMLGTATISRQRRSPMGWISFVWRGLRHIGEWLRRNTFEIGLDLRGEPRVKRGSPRIVIVLAIVLGIWTILAAAFAQQLPRDLRTWLIRGSYLLYLAPLAILWLGCILLTLLSAFLPAAMLHDRFVAAHFHPGPRPRRREWAAVFGYFVVMTALGSLLPVGVSLALCATFLATYLVFARLPVRASLHFLWRPTGTIRVRSLTWSDWVTWEYLLISLAVFALVLTSCGDRLWGAPAAEESMPITALLGMGLAWLAPGALGALLMQMLLGRWRDPARPAPPQATIAGVDTDELKTKLRQRFAEQRWTVRFQKHHRGAVDVPLRFAEPAQLSSDSEPSWPLPMSPNDLDDPAFWERIDRRWQIQLRRKLLSSLERLFKLTSNRGTGSGSGYWVAPHFWFVPGLMRDSQRNPDDEIDLADQSLLSGTVGPPYYRLMPRAVRHHAWEILRALQIDLIFVEDGVSFRRLRRVLRVLFEVFDVHGGRRAANELDFRGLPGIRVMIHEFQFDEPFKSETYPEPKYDYLGRARILHVFRDRGGHEELIEPPFDASRTPAPALMG